MYGVYMDTVSRNEYTGMTKFWFSPNEPYVHTKNGLIPCIGKITFPFKNMPMYLEGVWQNDCFHVTNARFPVNDVEQLRGLLHYLFPNLAENKINDIAELLGKDLFGAIKDAKIKKELGKTLSQRELRNLVHKLALMEQKQELSVALLNHGLPVDRIEMFLKRDITLEKLRVNPYMDFLFCKMSCNDAEIFLDQNIHPYATVRLIGFVYEAYLLHKKHGDTCVELHQFLNSVNFRLSKSIYPETRMNLPLLLFVLKQMKKYLKLLKIEQCFYIYGVKEYEEETLIIDNLKRLTNQQEKYEIDFDFSEIEAEMKIKLNDGQKRAVVGLLDSPGVKIMTGPPGSGKTTVVRAVIMGFQKMFPNKRIYLSATTGCAAQVLSRSCEMPATTAHKMLDIRPFHNDELQSRDQTNPVPGDLIIVDEVSMMGNHLCSFLLNAMKSKVLLILVGDKDQLESVEYGSILRELQKIESIPCYHLTEVMRQQGTILTNAALINQGIPYIKEDASFQCLSADSNEKALQTLLDTLTGNEKILTPIHGGYLGTCYLNQMLQQRFNGNAKVALEYGDIRFRENDPIIMTETNYKNGYYNGESGIIRQKTEKGVLVSFSDKILFLNKEDYHAIELAYALTIHKSQGSEFDHCVILLPEDAKHMMIRRLLYTAVTRSKKKVTMIGTRETFLSAVANKRERFRCNNLSARF